MHSVSQSRPNAFPVSRRQTDYAIAEKWLHTHVAQTDRSTRQRQSEGLLNITYTLKGPLATCTCMFEVTVVR